jgi:hypothetical protein
MMSPLICETYPGCALLAGIRLSCFRSRHDCGLWGTSSLDVPLGAGRRAFRRLGSTRASCCRVDLATPLGTGRCGGSISTTRHACGAWLGLLSGAPEEKSSVMKRSASTLLRRCSEGSAVFGKKATAKLTGVLAWNSFGIRDPSLLMDMDGSAILDQNGRLTLFFNARDCAIEDGGVTSVGIANGNHESGWSIRPMPVFVDGLYAAQGSVLQLAPDHFRMYYSPDTQRGFALASSTDGETWKKFGEQLILEPSAFGIRRMGLPFVRRVKNQWVMLFEGIDNDRFHIISIWRFHLMVSAGKQLTMGDRFMRPPPRFMGFVWSGKSQSVCRTRRGDSLLHFV